MCAPSEVAACWHLLVVAPQAASSPTLIPLAPGLPTSSPAMRLYTTTLPAAHPRAGRWRQGLGRAQFTCRSKAALVAEGRAGRQCPTGGDGGAAAASAAAAGVLPLGAVRLEAPGEVDMLVFDVHQGELAHRLENAVHLGQRWEHRLQRRAAALPVGARRLLAGGIAGACGKTSTAPLETVKMQLVAGHKGAWEAAAAIWRRGGAAAFFKWAEGRGPQLSELAAPAACSPMRVPAGDSLALAPAAAAGGTLSSCLLPPPLPPPPLLQGQHGRRASDHSQPGHRAVLLREPEEDLQVRPGVGGGSRGASVGSRRTGSWRGGASAGDPPA